MSESPSIKDYETYNHRMDLSMIDKMFFIDKIDPDLIVDFGCANGNLLREVSKLKKVPLIGYDNDEKMCKFSDDNILITDKWDVIKDRIYANHEIKNAALILSSVIHEVFHYGSKNDIDWFWHKVFDTGFKYIVIRDMIPSRAVDRISCINDVKKLYHKFLGTKALTDFERIWGTIENNRQMIHFLLKYKYLEPNWEREVRENYLPLAREDVLAKIPLNYDVIFHEHYVLPHLLQSVRDDMGIELKDPTHLKLILKKN